MSFWVVSSFTLACLNNLLGFLSVECSGRIPRSTIQWFYRSRDLQMNEQVSLQSLKLCWCVAKNSHLWLASYCKHYSISIAHCSPMLNLRWSSVDEYTLAVSWRMVQFCSWFLVLNVQDIWMRTAEWSMMRMLSQLLKNLTCLWAPLFRTSFQIYSRLESMLRKIYAVFWNCSMIIIPESCFLVNLTDWLAFL